ncbi:hypothetical protein LCGC14_2165070 [marine sediment metagenome]|uniref:ribose-phosphate diphosphokinase n=1 Tax=marine sediment metagenome TaxID=412755 RepID=A0A0F9DRR5_9ZZZZ
MNNFIIFSGTGNKELTKKICNYIEVDIGESEVTCFPDGEIIVKIKEDVRGKECFIVQPTCTPVNNNLMELLIFIDCLRRASSSTITAVIPYLGYARQDRKTEGRTPITARLVADLISATNVDRILTIDLHASQIEGFFNIPVDHLRAAPLFVKYFKGSNNLDNTVVLSPDVGNMKIAKIYAQELNVDIAVIDKRRMSDYKVVPDSVVGDIEGKDVLMFDDMLSTAGTICNASLVAQKRGAKTIKVAVTHGLFSTPLAQERLLSIVPVDEIVVTDTVPITDVDILEQIEKTDKGENIKPRISVLSVSSLLGEAISRIYYNRSVSVLLQSDYEYRM